MKNIISKYEKVQVYELKNGLYTVELNENPVEVTHEDEDGNIVTNYEVDSYRIEEVQKKSLASAKAEYLKSSAASIAAIKKQAAYKCKENEINNIPIKR
jgi:uncharacterized protein YejL (UPF0352 family)